MAFMLGDAGRVVGIEHIPELVSMATKNIQDDNPQLLISERIKLIGKNCNLCSWMVLIFLLYLYILVSAKLLFLAKNFSVNSGVCQ